MAKLSRVLDPEDDRIISTTGLTTAIYKTHTATALRLSTRYQNIPDGANKSKWTKPQLFENLQNSDGAASDGAAVSDDAATIAVARRALYLLQNVTQELEALLKPRPAVGSGNKKQKKRNWDTVTN
jgi:hypothetical protein